ncbi:MAG: hypothetical protein MR301_01530 [Prevotella sp.]|nr:hypothetical protein [Prevotella sp.]MDD7047410.1 hypothetical protein [Prevotella sp.]
MEDITEGNWMPRNFHGCIAVKSNGPWVIKQKSGKPSQADHFISIGISSLRVKRLYSG